MAAFQGGPSPGPLGGGVSAITVIAHTTPGPVATPGPNRVELDFRRSRPPFTEQEGANQGHGDADARHQGGPFQFVPGTEKDQHHQQPRIAQDWSPWMDGIDEVLVS